MASQSDLLSLAGVVVILLGMLMFNAVMARRPVRKEETSNDPTILCKFVVHEGSVVGETLAFEGDDVILKQAGTFKAVPRARLVPEGAELRLQGSMDWESALAKGAIWYAQRKSTDVDEVAGTMTRSEDVRAPALEAMKARDEEEEE